MIRIKSVNEDNTALIKFAKGQATENDFIIIPDENGELDLDSRFISKLCDRRTGLGADGVLRVVKSGVMGVGGDPDTWFMDYRNADGSTAEMCGNGIRLFAHWLVREKQVDSTTFTIQTRAGDRSVEVLSASDARATIKVDMGLAEVTGVSTCEIGGRRYAGLGIDVGNPHLACVIPGLTKDKLDQIDLSEPSFDHEFFPEGVNIELVTELSDNAVHMRVWERGVGETRSCGTGTVAATRAALADAGLSTGKLRVGVPGGEVEVEISEDSATLTGPSIIVAVGELDPNFYL